MMPPDSRPTCADPKWLPVVDEAFKHPTGPAVWDLAWNACRICPVYTECLREGMTEGVHGPWGGNSLERRMKRGAPKPRATPLKEAS